MKTALPLLLLVACGGRNTVVADCLTFHLDGTVDEAALVQNVRLAEEVDQPLLSEDFCTVFSNVDLQILPDDAWATGASNFTEGVTHGWGVELNNRVSSLAHEMFHVWDIRHGTVTHPDPHAGWDTNGRNAASGTYEHALAPINYQP